MSVIACVGEKLEDRESGKTNEVIFSQLDAIRKEVLADLFDGIVIAYEPVWAIGTGKVATPEQVGYISEFCRRKLIDTTRRKKFMSKFVNG